jgi:hypothetical protein
MDDIVYAMLTALSDAANPTVFLVEIAKASGAN